MHNQYFGKTREKKLSQGHQKIQAQKVKQEEVGGWANILLSVEMTAFPKKAKCGTARELVDKRAKWCKVFTFLNIVKQYSRFVRKLLRC